jgi:hypothetical protein
LPETVLFNVYFFDSRVLVKFVVFTYFDLIFGIEKFLRFFNDFLEVFEPLDEDSGDLNGSDFDNSSVNFSASCGVFGYFSTDFEVGINGLHKFSKILIFSIDLIHNSVE